MAFKHRLAVVTVVYWVLLSYMIAALVWWFVALQKQNNSMAQLRLSELKKDSPSYYEKALSIEAARKRKIMQYIGEGSTFLALIAVGAVFVFRATRKQLRINQQQQNFMMAVTHELKTPIAVTRLNLETMQKRKLNEAQQNRLITNTLHEANRLNTLCNNILLAAQLDAGAFAPTKEELNFSDLIEGSLDECATRFPDKKIVASINEGIYLTGEPLQLQMLVSNLVENAIKYSPKETAIHISLRQNHHKIFFSVKDEGQGISDDEKKKIFDMFYRTGNENTRKAKGTGLGLYLCKKIVKGHGGQITVTNNTPNGSIFTAIFTV